MQNLFWYATEAAAHLNESVDPRITPL